MNKDEQSLLDLLEAVRKERPQSIEKAEKAPEIAIEPAPSAAEEEKKPAAPEIAPPPEREEPAKKEPAEPLAEEPLAEETPEEEPESPQEDAPLESIQEETSLESAQEEECAEEPAEEPPANQEKKAEDTPAEKKKNIKFLILYMVIFVIVISGFIGGSYLVSYRMHREMGNLDEHNHSAESTLSNIQTKYKAEQEKNATLEASIAQLQISDKEKEELLTLLGDMVEQDQYLTAAYDSYIRGENDLAKAICRTIDRDLLSKPNQPRFDTLKEKLDL